MKSPETIRLQQEAEQRLAIITGQQVISEWQPFDKRMYPSMSSPKIDVAVGPYAIDEILEERYTTLQSNERIKYFLKHAREMHLQNLREGGVPQDMVRTEDFDRSNITNPNITNRNARCFIAVEIEGREDRKVVLADIVNTSAMGRVGIIVARTNKVLRIFTGLLHYNWYLGQVGKPHYTSSNVLLLSSEQFDQLLRRS